MEPKWQTLTAQADGNTLSSAEWNKVVSNAALLRNPNSVYVQADGDEPEQSLVVAAGEYGTVRHMTSSMMWGGGLLLVAYHVYASASVNPASTNIFLTQDYNSDELELITTSKQPFGFGSSKLSASGVHIWEIPTPPANPVEITFKLKVFGGAGGVTVEVAFTPRPGYFIWEIPE